MQWQPDTAFLQGLDFFSGAAAELDDPVWYLACPCQDWRALDVLGHVGQATRFGTLLLQGAQPAWAPVEPPGAAVEGSPAKWWQELAEQARSSVAGADLSEIVDSPMGPRSIGEGLSFPALDLFVHGWDIGKSAGVDLELPAGAIEFARSVLEPLPAGQVRNPRVFAAEKPAPADASDSQAFIAWTGRDPDWIPAA
ncbi:MAG: TIGR03086 family metal-binding protein [Streptosporangiaceae bacterium]